MSSCLQWLQKSFYSQQYLTPTEWCWLYFIIWSRYFYFPDILSPGATLITEYWRSSVDVVHVVQHNNQLDKNISNLKKEGEQATLGQACQLGGKKSGKVFFQTLQSYYCIKWITNESFTSFYWFDYHSIEYCISRKKSLVLDRFDKIRTRTVVFADSPRAEDTLDQHQCPRSHHHFSHCLHQSHDDLQWEVCRAGSPSSLNDEQQELRVRRTLWWSPWFWSLPGRHWSSSGGCRSHWDSWRLWGWERDQDQWWSVWWWRSPQDSDWECWLRDHDWCGAGTRTISPPDDPGSRSQSSHCCWWSSLSTSLLNIWCSRPCH